MGASFALAADQPQEALRPVALSVVAFIGIAFLYGFVRFVPPLVRIKAALRGRIESVADPDGYRLGGVLYIAPKDPALFVARKGGYGSTLNLGRPGAWLFLLVLVVVPLVFAWALSSR